MLILFSIRSILQIKRRAYQYHPRRVLRRRDAGPSPASSAPATARDRSDDIEVEEYDQDDIEENGDDLEPMSRNAWSMPAGHNNLPIPPAHIPGNTFASSSFPAVSMNSANPMFGPLAMQMQFAFASQANSRNGPPFLGGNG